MDTFYDKLQRIVGWVGDEGARALTLYLDVSTEAAGKARAFAEQACDEALEAAARGADVAELAEAWRREFEGLEGEIERARASEHDGLCLFVAVSPPLRELVVLRFSVETEAIVDRVVHPGRLLEIDEEYERTVAVVVLGGEAWVVQVHAGDAVDAQRMRPTHGRTVAQEVAVELHRHLAAHPRSHIVLVGEDTEVSALEGAFDAGIAARVIGRHFEALRHDDPAVLRAVHRAQQANERQREAEGVNELEALLPSGGAVAGLAATIDALNLGRARKLLVLQGLDERGWRCDACDRLGAPPVPPACTSCGASVSEVALVEELEVAAMRSGAEIDTVLASPKLAAMGGIGAILHATTPPPGPVAAG